MFATTEDTLKNLSQVIHGTSTAFQRQLVTAEVKKAIISYKLSNGIVLYQILSYSYMKLLYLGTFQDPLCTEHRVWQRHRISV